MAGDASSADWRELPSELLHRVFAAVFPPPDQPAPLLDLFQQHASLQLTCKAWAAALEHTHYEVSVETCLPPRGSHAWLQRHAAALIFRRPETYEICCMVLGVAMHSSDCGDSGPKDARSIASVRWLSGLSGPPGPHGYWEARPQPPHGAPSAECWSWAADAEYSCLLGYEQLMLLLSYCFQDRQEMQQHDDSMRQSDRRVRPIAELLPIPHMLLSCRRLRTLCLDDSADCRYEADRFDTPAVMAGLTQLKTLALIGWGPPNLYGLPRTLRTLVVRGFGFPALPDDSPPMVRHWHPAEFALPKGLRVESAAVIGFGSGCLQSPQDLEATPEEDLIGLEYAWQLDLPRMWRSCRELLVDAEVLCLDGECMGVPPLTNDARPLLRALCTAMSGAAPLRRLVIASNEYWAWDPTRPATAGAQPDDAATAGGDEAASDSELEEADLEGEWQFRDMELFYAAGLAHLQQAWPTCQPTRCCSAQARPHTQRAQQQPCDTRPAVFMPV
ncbi:hypothetical protein COHA_006416 [Chlorella ohadii]|uniref:Uncharacterized protein n=1 Tax=Chlorella ohadii TaxID=2649997 RepID=A0AAD5H3V0_9CHLO|nr:hypothetical protein COHA_006416 [Chlorella ohadii]